MPRIFLILITIILGVYGNIHAAEPPTAPILRIETGMHTAQIRRIATDAAGRWLVTASDDKSLRVWDLSPSPQPSPSGRGSMQPTRIIRPPIGEGNEGKLYSVAISPDGATLACGGWTGSWDKEGHIYLFNRATGTLIHRITGLPNVIQHLAFSPDGRYMAAALGGDNGIRLYRARVWSLAGEDKDYGGASYSAHFAADDRLVTTSWDGYIRLYMLGETGRSPLQLITKEKAPGGSQPVAARFSPDGSRVAVGYNDTTAVSVLSGRSLTPLYSPDISGVQNVNLGSLAWSVDGRYLYAGGIWHKQFDGISKFPIRSWSDAGKSGFSDTAAANGTIMDISPLPDGSIAFGASGPDLGVIDSLGKRTLLIPLTIVNYPNNKDKFLISSDGSQVGFGYEFAGKSPATFDLGGRKLTPLNPPLSGGKSAPSPDKGRAEEGLSPPITTHPGLNITDWYNTTAPKLNGTPLKLKQYENSFSLAIASDGNSFILGTHFNLRRFNRQGEQLWEIPVPGTAWAVNIAKNGKVAVAAFGDGTIRWYRYSDGKELLAFFPHADRKRWVLWTPEGFFDHSPGGEELIGWHLNQGKDKEALFFSASKLYKEFYRPDLVTASFEGKDLSAFAKAIDINKILSRETIPPTVHFLTKSGSADNYDTSIRAQVCDTGGGIGDVTLFLNNMPVAVETAGRGLKVAEKNRDGQCYSFERTITLSPGANSIQLMAYNKANTIESHRDTIEINHAVKTAQPELHVLTVAVNAYRDGDLRLKYALPDADALAEQVQAKGKGLFDKVHIHTLRDGDVTKEGLAQKFASIGSTMKREDVFLLFVAGHGITDEKEGAYYFLPTDFRYTGEGEVQKQGVSMTDFRNMLANVQAMKSLILLDTCNSGSFAEAIASRGMIEKTAITKLSRSVGRATIVASSKSQVALEGYEGHGAFTWTLLEGMRGKAADKGGKITINTLATFIEEELPKLTYKKWGYEQIPQKTLQGMDFQIGVR
jgi:WD40 repeat protein